MVDAKRVAELRELTGAGMMDCKEALIDSLGDIDMAVDILRVNGLAKLEKKGNGLSFKPYGMLVWHYKDKTVIHKTFSGEETKTTTRYRKDNDN